MDKHLRRIHLRDELRRLIIPLMQKCINECPQDLTTFCSEYFQSLLNSRNTTYSQENRESTSSDEPIMSSCEDANKPAVQGSTSLPILNKEESGAQLRETGSWNESSRPRQTPAQPKKVHFSAIEHETQIGDHLNVKEECTDKYSNNFGENDQPKDGEVLTSIAEKNEGHCENNDASHEVFNAHLSPSSVNVLPTIRELEKEFDNLVTSAFCSLSRTPASSRKKWKIEDDAYWQLDRQFKRPERDEVESEDEAYPLSFKTQEPAESVVATNAGDVKLNVPFVSSPISRNVMEREERLEKSVLLVLKELKEMIHTLCAFRLEFDYQLHEIRQTREGRDRTDVVVRPPTPPRKKRPEPVTENSKNGSPLSEDRHSSGLDECDLDQDIHGKSEKRAKSAEFIEDKNIRNEQRGGHLEQKESSDTNITQDTSKLSKEDFSMKSDREIRFVKPQVPNSSCTFDVQPKTENSEAKEIKNENRRDDRYTESHMTTEFKSGMKYSKLEESPKEKSHNRPENKRTNIYPDKHPKCQEFQNFPRQNPWQTKYSNTFNMPIDTRSQRRGRKNRSPNHRGFRRGHSYWSTWQRPSSSSFLEGGDVLQTTTNTQRSVATDTNSLGIRERSRRNSNDGRRLEANISPFNGRLARDNFNRERKRAFEKELVGNETIKNTSTSKRTGFSKSPQKYLKGVDRSLKPNDMPSKPIKKSEDKSVTHIQNTLNYDLNPDPLLENSKEQEPKSDSPLQYSMKEDIKPDPPQQNSGKLENKSEPPLQNSLKNEPKSDLPLQNSKKQEPKSDSPLQNYGKHEPKPNPPLQNSGKEKTKPDPVLQNSKKQGLKSDSPLQNTGKHEIKIDLLQQNSGKLDPKSDPPLQYSKKHEPKSDPRVQDPEKQEPKSDLPLQNSGKQEPKSDLPLQNSRKHEPKPDPPLQNSEKEETETDHLLQNPKKQELKSVSPLQNSGKYDPKPDPPLHSFGKNEPKPNPSLQNPEKYESKHPENVEQGKQGFEIRRALSNSSLNPSAKSFQPSNFLKEKEKFVSPVNYQNSPNAQRRERHISEDTEGLAQRKDSGLSGRRNFGFTIDWAAENTDTNGSSEERRTIAPHRENGCSGSKKNVDSKVFTSPHTTKLQRETFNSCVRLNGASHQPEKENDLRERNDKKTANDMNGAAAHCDDTFFKRDGGAHCTEHNQPQDISPIQQSGLSLASGDLVTSDADDRAQLIGQENLNQSSNVAMNPPGLESPQGARNPEVGLQYRPHREEPGLSAACGDFVAAADGGRNQPPPVHQEGRLNALIEEMRSAATNPPNPDLNAAAPQVGNRSARGMEEIEFNFTCESGSETSELDSSEMSEYAYD